MIVVIGSANIDLIGAVTRLPRPGETVPGSTFTTAPGGKGANQALAARRAGSAVKLVGAVGSDPFAGQAIELLDRDGVDLAALRHVEGPTGIAMILVDASGENVIAVLPGANASVSSADVDKALAGLAPSDIVVVQQEVPVDATRRALSIAREKNARSILNTAPFLETTAETAALADIVIANETEFARLSGGGDLDVLMAGWSRTHGQTVVVTLGGEGAIAVDGDTRVVVPAMKIVPVDTVGAGDTFVGYFAAALTAGLSLEPAVRRAVVASALACLKPGAQPAIPYASEVDAAAAK